jgi:hypothetical protein
MFTVWKFTTFDTYDILEVSRGTVWLIGLNKEYNTII